MQDSFIQPWVRRGRRLIVLIGSFVCGSGSGLAALDMSDAPLLLQSSVKPNIVLMLDNSGSMHNILPDTPFDAGTTYLSSCPAGSLVDENWDVDIRLVGNKPEIVANNVSHPWGAGTNKYCFGSNKQYYAKLYANVWEDFAINYGGATYSGNFLNWYFNPSNTTPSWTSGQKKKPGTFSRMEVARDAANGVIDGLDNVRMGLVTYNGNDGGKLDSQLGDLDSSKKTELKTKINALLADSNTPVAETLNHIGRYLTRGYSGNLTIHPGFSNEATHSINELFGSAAINNSTGSASLDSPVQYSCQKSFALLLTDGEPSQDQNVSVYFADYDGDCSGSNASACGSFDKKNSATYIDTGSDYLDDVAQALYDIDLRPDLVDSNGEINNLITHTIGFADPVLLNHPLLAETASQGGGRFYTAENAQELVTALEDAVDNLLKTVSSVAAVVGNSSRLSDDSTLYQARFDSGDWSGDLIAYDLSSGEVGGELWHASEEIPSAVDRNILSYDGSQGIEFKFSAMTDVMKTAMLSADHVAYLRGDHSKEIRKGGSFRNRSTALGDIINADAHSVASQDFGYSRLGGDAGAAYPAFQVEKKSRAGMIYVGANDGMLHGFDALTGVERVAYVPNDAIRKRSLVNLTSPSYSHRYFVDGHAVSGDAWVDRGDGEAWGTFLAGTMGAGGKAVFALDVSDPLAIGADDVLWEFSHSELGFSFGKPAIVQMETGDWVVVFANGYDSSSQTARLFVVDLLSGTLLRQIDTAAGSASEPNGLSSPTLLDTDGNGRIDTAYAGDLLGNLWKFNLSDSSFASGWKVSWGSSTPAPLFKAVDSDGTSQPITAAPEVSDPPEGKDGYMVTVGTGSYFRDSDQQDSSTQTLYGLWDNGTAVSTSGRTGLQQQTIVTETDKNGNAVRVMSDNSINWTTQRGWYLDLPAGERVVSNPLLRHGRVIFTTMQPNVVPCEYEGESWLIEIDAVTGGRLPYSALDLNGDLVFDDADYVDITSGSETESVAVSGIRFDAGIVKMPFVFADGELEYKLAAGSSGTISRITEKGSQITPRSSWRQLSLD